MDPGTVLMWIFGSILVLLWLLFLFYGEAGRREPHHPTHLAAQANTMCESSQLARAGSSALAASWKGIPAAVQLRQSGVCKPADTPIM
jgi:hypothetical protein